MVAKRWRWIFRGRGGVYRIVDSLGTVSRLLGCRSGGDSQGGICDGRVSCRDGLGTLEQGVWWLF